MWVGESEKNIKQIFDSYRQKVEEFKMTPILLFNEADAIISKRQEGAERAVDKMENTIQNIILQEMELLDGILIATTNLAQNMDKAFERRFLYKINFTKPTLEARISIWHEMIPARAGQTDEKASEPFWFRCLFCLCGPERDAHGDRCRRRHRSHRRYGRCAVGRDTV